MKFGLVSVEDYPAVMDAFATNLMDDKFIGNKCKTCGKKYFPPRRACENFHEEMEDYEVSTEATMKAYTVIHFAPDSLSDKAPYVAVIGELEPGIKVLAHLVGLMSKPKVGMKMKLKSQKVDDERVYYKFIPA